MQIIRIPLMSPKANAHVERMIGSLRRECLDHLLVHNEYLRSGAFRSNGVRLNELPRLGH